MIDRQQVGFCRKEGDRADFRDDCRSDGCVAFRTQRKKPVSAFDCGEKRIFAFQGVGARGGRQPFNSPIERLELRQHPYAAFGNGLDEVLCARMRRRHD